MPTRKTSKNIKTILSVLDDEVRGDISAALSKLSSQYKMTWIYQSASGELFPKVGPGIGKRDMADAYQIVGRKYDIRNIAEGDDLVMLELVESYPDQGSTRTFRTPLVLVLELKNGKIFRGRHYCDPRLSYKSLSTKRINEALS